MKIFKITISIYILLLIHSTVIVAFAEGMTVANVAGTGYYFSSVKGNDNNAGTSSGSPWRSMDKLKQIAGNLKAGDIVYLERGSSWDKVSLTLNNLSGTAGSPISFMAYGAGPAPRLKGSRQVSSFSQQGNLWKCIDKSLPDYSSSSRRVIPFLYINSQDYEISRYPNTGYLTSTTQGTSNWLEDYTQNWTTNQWSNGFLCARAVTFEWATQRITGNYANSLQFESLPNTLKNDKTPYLIRNHANACDQNGEWAQQHDTLWVYYSGNLNSLIVEAPVIDTLIMINNCTNLIFNNIQFERSNMMNFSIKKSTVSFQSCSVLDAGFVLVDAADYSSVTINQCYFSGGRRNGVHLIDGTGTITNSVFRNFAFEGADNGDGFYGSAILSNRAKGITTIAYNDFDSVDIAFNCHFSDAVVNFRYNFIRNYGMTLEDCGAVYVGGDYTNFNKHISRNIFLDARNKFVHAVYLDYMTSNTYIDSNSICNSNIAIYFHVCDDNVARYNNIVNPATHMLYPWNSAFRLDEYSYHHGNEGEMVNRNTVEYNNVVFSPNKDELASVFFNLSSINTNPFRYNKYFDPYTGDDDIIVKGENYDLGSYSSFNLSSWNAATGLEYGSSRNPTNWIYQSSLGIPQDKFVLFLYNPTRKDSIFDLTKYNAEYYDVNGNIRSGSVTIKPYYSEILFYKQKGTAINHPPVISKQTFFVSENEPGGEVIGRVAASDPDAGQTLKYSITEGNTGNIFSINAGTGQLYLTNDQIDFVTDITYVITVSVVDDGTPGMSGSNQITIQIKALNHPPDFNNQVMNVAYEKPLVVHIGKISAHDPDPGQVLHYTLATVDSNFMIDNATGDVYLNNTDLFLSENTTFYLSINVSDNGNPSCNTTAQLIINYIYKGDFIYIDPENINDPVENGSYAHPFDSWKDVTWTADYAYLQKANTICEIDALNIMANKVSISSYGSGNKPVIKSATDNFFIRAYNAQDIKITNLIIDAPNALSCMYFFGSDCYNVTIRNCEIRNSKSAVKVTSGYNFSFYGNKFANLESGLDLYSKNNKIYYNLFINNTLAVKFNGDYSNDEIINNVFYSNSEGIESLIDNKLSLYNNIFYFEELKGLAFATNEKDFTSDHNVFFPDFAGLVRINERSFNNFGEYQNLGLADKNSFVNDPQFVDTENDDFSVSLESPVIDAGIEYQQEVDYFGTPVPIGDMPDIGAVESKTSATGIKTFEPENQLILYPNPSDGTFTLKIPHHELFKKGLIRINTLTGKTVYSRDFYSGEENGLHFDNAGPVLEKGYYLLHIELDSKTFSVEKLVIL